MAALPVVTLVVIATVALVLDAVDGQGARRGGTASALGARFDLEVDAFLILVLSVHVAVLVGPVGAGHRRDALRVRRGGLDVAMDAVGTSGEYSTKTVAALQEIVLVVATTEVLPHRLAVALVSTALALARLVFRSRRGVAQARHASMRWPGVRVRSPNPLTGRRQPRAWILVADHASIHSS